MLPRRLILQSTRTSPHRRVTEDEGEDDDHHEMNEARPLNTVTQVGQQQQCPASYHSRVDGHSTRLNRNDAIDPSLRQIQSLTRFPECAQLEESTAMTLKLDGLPTEVLIRILEFLFPATNLIPGTAEINTHRRFIDSMTRSPFFSDYCPNDHRNAVNLLLTNKRLHHDTKVWLYSRRRFDFATLDASRNFYARIGAEAFKLLAKVEFVNWGRQPNTGASNLRLRTVVCCLEGIQSLGLLFFNKGVQIQDQKRTSEEWSTFQLAFMLSILETSPQLTRVYHREEFSQLRFCSETTRKLPEETEVEASL